MGAGGGSTERTEGNATSDGADSKGHFILGNGLLLISSEIGSGGRSLPHNGPNRLAKPVRRSPAGSSGQGLALPFKLLLAWILKNLFENTDSILNTGPARLYQQILFFEKPLPLPRRKIASAQ